MNAEIISVGSELLSGAITDTNATYLAKQLAGLGIQLRRVTQVGDRLTDIVDALRTSALTVDLVACTGGIGPTPDDLTREAVAELLGERMEVDPGLLAILQAFFAGRGYPMPAANAKQATLIPSATPLRNRSGTAPGWWVQHEGTVIILMPGVPVEMRTIWEEEVSPRLQGRSGTFIETVTLKTHGLGESTIAERLGDLLSQESPMVATYAKSDGVQVVVRAVGTVSTECRRQAEATAEAIASLLGENVIWGRDGDTLAGGAMSKVQALGLSLATSELATQGILSARLAALASPAYRGGTVLNGVPPEADLLLSVGAPYEDSSSGVTWHICEVALDHNGKRVAGAEARAPAGAALAERATAAALHLLIQELRSGALRAAVTRMRCDVGGGATSSGETSR